MKKIYICGDSFGCPDLGWNIQPWPIQLAEKLGTQYKIINLSVSCASNLLIRMQVDRAIKESADFVILLGTTCTRFQGQIKETKIPHSDIYDRFVKIGQQDSQDDTRDLACYSILSLNESCVFNQDDIQAIKNYTSKLFNLDLAIYENQCIIESSLSTLEQNNIRFIFDQGGFENPIFGNVKKLNYFSNFEKYKSEINQWTLSSDLPKSNKVHFHILDQEIHNTIAEYYKNKIIQNV